jgi:hypothetical protein
MRRRLLVEAGNVYTIEFFTVVSDGTIISDARPNSALERTSARYSASLESRASSRPKPLSFER